MNKPKDINLGYGWWVRFEDDEMPVYIEYIKGGKTYGASLGFFETHFTTSCDAFEFEAPLNVIEAFEANEEIIYAWENDYFERNPRE